MRILSYLVLPAAGAARQVERQLAALPGCEVVCAENRDLLILVTETACDADEQALLASFAELEGISAMSLTFAAMDP